MDGATGEEARVEEEIRLLRLHAVGEPRGDGRVHEGDARRHGTSMEAALEKTTYVAGDTYTLADCVATAFLARVHVVKDETVFGQRTAAYWNEK